MSEALAVSAGTLRRPSAAFQITVLVLFFVLGACGLIYEVLWARLLTLSFGVTVLAAALGTNLSIRLVADAP